MVYEENSFNQYFTVKRKDQFIIMCPLMQKNWTHPNGAILYKNGHFIILKTEHMKSTSLWNVVAFLTSIKNVFSYLQALIISAVIHTSFQQIKQACMWLYL